MRSDPNSYFDTTEIKENLAQKTVRGGLLSGRLKPLNPSFNWLG